MELGWEQKQSFEKIKEILYSPNLSIHYNPEKCDTSPYGLDAVLSHTLPGSSEKTIPYSSEKNYSQIEKESLAIIFAIKKFQQYIFGRHVTIVTDHKRLLGILTKEKGIPQLAASRLQRCAITLSGYNYTLKYKIGTPNSNANCRSQFPKDCDIDFSKLEDFAFLTDLVVSPVTSLDIKNESAKDQLLAE